MKATLIADSLGNKKRQDIFWNVYRKKSCTGFDSRNQQNVMTEYGQHLLRKQHRGVQLFNSLVGIK